MLDHRFDRIPCITFVLRVLTSHHSIDAHARQQWTLLRQMVGREAGLTSKDEAFAAMEWHPDGDRLALVVYIRFMYPLVTYISP